MEKASADSVLDRVTRIVCESTGAESLSLTAKWADVTEDSLEAASLIVELENEFNIDIDGVYGYATVGDLVKYIEAKL